MKTSSDNDMPHPSMDTSLTPRSSSDTAARSAHVGSVQVSFVFAVSHELTRQFVAETTSNTTRRCLLALRDNITSYYTGEQRSPTHSSSHPPLPPSAANPTASYVGVSKPSLIEHTFGCNIWWATDDITTRRVTHTVSIVDFEPLGGRGEANFDTEFISP